MSRKGPKTAEKRLKRNRNWPFHWKKRFSDPKWPKITCFDPKTSYRDFKNKLHKVNGVFRPLQCFKLPEILCSIITRVAFLKIENKKMTIGQVEELWRSRIQKPRKLTIVETFNFCTIRRLNLTSHFTEIFSSKFQAWLILFRI